MSSRLVLVLWSVCVGVGYAEQPKAKHTYFLQGGVKWLIFSTDSKHLYAGVNAQSGVVDDTETQVQVWDVQTGKPTLGPAKGSGIGATGTISPDGKLLLTGGTNGEWRLWKVTDLAIVASGKTDGGRIHRLAFSPDNKTFAALNANYLPRNKIKYSAWTYDTKTQKSLATNDWPAENETSGEPSDWGLFAPPVFDKEGLPVPPKRELAGPLEVPNDEDNCGGPMAYARSTDGKFAVSAGCNGSVVLWDYPNRKVIGKPLAQYDRLAVGHDCLAIANDGRLVAMAINAQHSTKGHLYRIEVYDTTTRQRIFGPVELGYSGVGLIEAFAFSPDATHLAVGLNRLGGELKGPTHELQLWAMPAKKKP